jgi:hypothetical protein
MYLNKYAIINNNNNGNNNQNTVSTATGRESITVVTQYYVYKPLAIDNIHKGTIIYNTIHLS